MEFKILLGEPYVSEYWKELESKNSSNKIAGKEKIFFDKLLKALKFLSVNPKHNSLQTHEIEPLSKKYGMRIWQSYLENKVPAAGRIFWTYGPNKNEITILAIEPHPNMKSRSYNFIKLSKFDVPKK